MTPHIEGILRLRALLFGLYGHFSSCSHFISYETVFIKCCIFKIISKVTVLKKSRNVENGDHKELGSLGLGVPTSFGDGNL